jgi:hypothetical protein
VDRDNHTCRWLRRQQGSRQLAGIESSVSAQICAAMCGSIRQLSVGMKLKSPYGVCIHSRGDSLANGEHLAEQYSVEEFVQVLVSTEAQGR